MRLTAASGATLGVLAVLHDQPLHESALGQTILNVFAARAGAELERIQAEGERRRTLAIMDEASDFIGSTNLQGNFLFMNAAARRLLRYWTRWRTCGSGTFPSSTLRGHWS